MQYRHRHGGTHGTRPMHCYAATTGKGVGKHQTPSDNKSEGSKGIIIIIVDILLLPPLIVASVRLIRATATK